MMSGVQPVPASVPTLVGLLWPGERGRWAPPCASLALMLVGSALLTLSAKIQVPLPPVPMTLQTLVVLMLGAAYGWRLGGATVALYLAEGLAGLPVFAGSGLDRSTSPARQAAS
jgi:biotin transport system substrate-specific component